MKKVLAGILCAVMLISVFSLAACAPKPNVPDASGATGDSGAPAPSDGEAKHVDFVFYGHGAQTPAKKPKYQDEVEKTINEKLAKDCGFTADFNVTIHPDDVAMDKLMLDLAAKKPIDFARFAPIGGVLGDLYAKKMLTPLNDILEDCPNLMKNIPQNLWDEVTVDGEIVALPMPVFQTVVTGWTRMDLLKQAKMEMPKTLDELEAFLVWVKSAYPDMIPLITPIRNLEIFLLGTFTEHPGDFLDSDGKIKPQKFDEGYRRFVERMAEWYKKGLIDDSLFTTDENQAIDLFGKGKCAIAGGNIWQLEWGTLNAVNKDHPEWEVTFIEPLEGKSYVSDGLATEVLVIPATSENAYEALRFADWCLYNEENYRLVMSGIKGKSYDIIEKDGKHFMGIPESEGDVAPVDLYQPVWTGYNGPLNFTYDSPTTPDESMHAYRSCMTLPMEKVYVPITNYYAVKLPADINIAKADAEQIAATYVEDIIRGLKPVSAYDDLLAEYEEVGGLQAYEIYTEKFNEVNSK